MSRLHNHNNRGHTSRKKNAEAEKSGGSYLNQGKEKVRGEDKRDRRKILIPERKKIWLLKGTGKSASKRRRNGGAFEPVCSLSPKLMNRKGTPRARRRKIVKRHKKSLDDRRTTRSARAANSKKKSGSKKPAGAEIPLITSGS